MNSTWIKTIGGAVALVIGLCTISYVILERAIDQVLEQKFRDLDNKFSDVDRRLMDAGERIGSPNSTISENNKKLEGIAKDTDKLQATVSQVADFNDQDLNAKIKAINMILGSDPEKLLSNILKEVNAPVFGNKLQVFSGKINVGGLVSSADRASDKNQVLKFSDWITFEKSFLDNPIVFLSIINTSGGTNIDKEHLENSWRFAVETAEVTPTGFRVQAGTWDGSYADVWVSWIAMGTPAIR